MKMCIMADAIETQQAVHNFGGNSSDALQLLSNNTRRTKVVELSSGTHRYLLRCKQLFPILAFLMSAPA